MLELLTRRGMGDVSKRAGRLAVAALILAALPLASTAAEPQAFTSQKASLLVETLATGLDHPWSVEVLPDGAYIVAERPGTLRIIRADRVSAPIQDAPRVFARGQGGLLDLALSPDFATNRTLFLTYSAPGPGGAGTVVARATLSADEKSLKDVRQIFAMNRFTRKTQHFGSRIVIAADGSLFFGIGDRGERSRAQDPRDHAGSVLHITAEGSVAGDNPFAGHNGGLPEVWSKGHRNPQGIDIDPKDGRLVTVEHGARGGDEVNYPLPGKNYGWPIITYGKDYSGAEIGEGAVKEGYEQPAYYWDPSIAPGAIAVYRGAMFPEWDGSLLVAALKYQMLVRLERDETGAVVGEERLFDGAFGRLRDVKVAPDGAVLMVTDEDNGSLLRLYRAPSSQ